MAKEKETAPVINLADEVERLKAELAALTAEKKQTSADEALIKEKMAAGLTRPQAEAVIKHQRAFDAKLKGAEKK